MENLVSQCTAQGDLVALRDTSLDSERMEHAWNGLDGGRCGVQRRPWRDGEGDPLKEGLGQLDSYLSGLGLEL